MRRREVRRCRHFAALDLNIFVVITIVVVIVVMSSSSSSRHRIAIRIVITTVVAHRHHIVIVSNVAQISFCIEAIRYKKYCEPTSSRGYEPQ